MANVQQLVQLLKSWDAYQEDIDMIVSFIKENGPGKIYAISTEYNDYYISVEDAQSLQEVYDEMNNSIVADCDEGEEPWDYWEDFENSPEGIESGILFGEGFFFVRID